jgi:ABC-type transport system involved in multi-copper enzyme maturation permease subunit
MSKFDPELDPDKLAIAPVRKNTWRPRRPVVGPLLAWELTRVARKGHAHRARLIVLYLVTMAFLGVIVVQFGSDYLIHILEKTGPTLSPKGRDAFAQNFALGMFETVLAAVVLMTPAFAALAISEEKDRRTLDLLLSTPLDDREIVLGKAAARLVYQLTAVAAGIPVICIIFFLGRVSLETVVGAVMLIATTTALATAIGVQASCATDTLRAGIIRAYVMTVVFIGGGILTPLVFLSPFVVLYWLFGIDPSDFPILSATIFYSMLQLGIAAALLSDAIGNLRKLGLTVERLVPPKPAKPFRAVLVDEWNGPKPKPRKSPAASGPKEDEKKRPDPQRFLSDNRLPRVDDNNPVGWKERHFAGHMIRGESAIAAGAVFGVLWAIFMLIGYIQILEDWHAKAEHRPDYLIDNNSHYFFVAGGTIAMGLYVIPVGIGVAGAIARERQLRTLDDLLSIPRSRREIIEAKFETFVRKNWGVAIGAILSVGLGFWCRYNFWVGLTASELVFAGFAMVVGLGALLTVRCPNHVRTFRLILPVMVMTIGIPLAIINVNEMVADRWVRDALPAAAVLFALSGVALWRRACREFDELG